jgi:hypothetical protein
MFFELLKNWTAKALFAQCLILGFAATAAAQAETPPNFASASAAFKQRSSATSTDRYYIDFRVAQIGAYGHSYVAYGRLNAGGKPADAHYADLHPMGNYLVMAVGHVLPVPANTVWDPDVLKLPVATSYMRPLSAAQYARLQVALRKAQAERQPYWNAITNNCNHFIGELAQAVGLRVPPDFQVSYLFVPSLRRMNEYDQATASTAGWHGSSNAQGN